MSDNDHQQYVKGSIERIRTSLLDLTRRNRLLNFKKSARSLVIVDELPDEVFRILVHEGQGMFLSPIPEPDLFTDNSDEGSDSQSGSASDQGDSLDIAAELAKINISEELPTPPSPDEANQAQHVDNQLQTKLFMPELETKLRRIRSHARSVIEETGRNQLYLAIGFLGWREHDSEDTWNDAPLIMLPVELSRTNLDSKSDCYRYSLKFTDDDIISNLCLKEKMERDFGVKLPLIESFNGSEEQDFVADEYLSAVSESVSEMREWTVSRRITLSFFSFAGLLMFLDLDEDEWHGTGSLIGHPIINSLLLGSDECADNDPGQSELDEDYIDSNIPLVLDADSSQIDAIQAAESGKNLVIHGPPGTGKSQTITNLIAYYLFSGKSVLFMSDKLAALNVVQRNLERAGLSDFCLELHSHKVQKKRVHAALEKRLHATYRSPSDIDEDIAFLRSHREALGKYVRNLHKVHEGTHKSLYDIIGRCEFLSTNVMLRPGLRVKFGKKLDNEGIQQRREQLDIINRFAARSLPPWKSVWRNFCATDLFFGDHEAVREVLDTVILSLTSLNSDVTQLTSLLSLDNARNGWTLNDLKCIARLSETEPPSKKYCELAVKLLMDNSGMNRRMIRNLADMISRHADLLREINNISTIPSELTKTNVGELFDSIQDMRNFSLEHLTLKDATVCYNAIANFEDALSRANNLMQAEKMAGVLGPSSLSGIERILEVSAALWARPRLIQSKYFNSIVDQTTQGLIEKAWHLSKRIEEDKARLSDVFSLSDVPNKSILQESRRTIRANRKNWFRILSKDYRSARRILLSFLRHNVSPISLQVLDDLESLEGYILASEEFKSLVELEPPLRDLFSGTRTNVDEVSDAISWWNCFVDIIGDVDEAKDMAIISDRIVKSLPSKISIENLTEEFRLCTELLTRSLPSDHSLAKSLQDSTISFVDLDHDLSEITGAIMRLENSLQNIGFILGNGQSLTVCDLLTWVDMIKKIHDMEDQIFSDSRLRTLLGSHFEGTSTRIDDVNSVHQWAMDIHKLDLPASIIDALAVPTIESLWTQMHNLVKPWPHRIDEIRAKLSLLDDYGQMDWKSTLGVDLQQISCSDLKDGLSLLVSDVNDLPAVADYVRARKSSAEMGLISIVELIEDDKIAPEHAADLFELTVLSRLAQELISKNPALNSFTAEEHEAIRSKFVDLDLTIKRQNILKVASMASQSRPPTGVGRGPVRELTELSLLKHEIGKSRRHIPIRQLMRRAGTAIKKLTPVMMMSPHSVAQFLEPKAGEFDVIIMDEASQIRPEEALGAIARAKQIIVVGDPKQLPPTSFFRSSVDEVDYEDETTVDDTDSVLDLCISTNMNQRYLRWHYRSEHESLIAFSNSNWYDNRLIVFPSADQSASDLGVFYKYIEHARYSNGKNEIEAREVARAVIEHASSCPELSIGVGTFGQKQQQLIEDQIEKIAKLDPVNRELLDRISDASETLEPLFVKNLENIQGDERDVIIISTTYGPDRETGRVMNRFGPINMKHGPRRLNVLFTRARRRMVVFTSMKPEDIQIGPDRSPGAIALSRFLSYAKSGVIPDYGEVTGREPDSDFEVAVAHALSKHGYQTTLQLGVSGYFVDIAIKDPDRPGMHILAVECDGATYHSSKYARDRDRLREEVLRRRGWDVFRIWSIEWFKNREVVIERLIGYLSKLRADRAVTITADNQPDEKQPEQIVRDSVAVPLTDEQLMNRLKVYSKQFEIESSTNGFIIFSLEMLTALVKHKPVDMATFRNTIPAHLRRDLEEEEFDKLDDMLGIIEQAVS